jgi:hypothetical protein
MFTLHIPDLIVLAIIRLNAYYLYIPQDFWGIMMDYISVREAAENWGISERRVQKLCEQGRVSARGASVIRGCSRRKHRSLKTGV